MDKSVYDKGPKPPNIRERCRAAPHPFHQDSSHDSQVVVSPELTTPPLPRLPRQVPTALISTFFPEPERK